jgi:single-strand DNA-binding protein
MFGQRAETLAPFMLKSSAHCFTLSDMHIETYVKGDGSQGVKLAARVDDVELGPRQDGAAHAQRQAQAPARTGTASSAPTTTGHAASIIQRIRRHG